MRRVRTDKHDSRAVGDKAKELKQQVKAFGESEKSLASVESNNLLGAIRENRVLKVVEQAKKSH